MNRLDIPFNIDLLVFTDKVTSLVKPITSLDVFEGMTKNFHPDGLFSTVIFGNVGTDVRYKKFSYIDLKIPILHPIVYNAYTSVKRLYADILASKVFVLWDEEKLDFVPSTSLEGFTGYAYFMEHRKKIAFDAPSSDTRTETLKLIEKYKDKCELDKIYVMPAAYRDLEIDENGRESSDEINKLYYKLLAVSNTISKNTAQMSERSYNSQRNSLQLTYNALYESVLNIVQGKKNLFTGKWASRKIWNGTRNVISSMHVKMHDLDKGDGVGINDTVVGLYQFAKAALPITRHQLKKYFLEKVFPSVSAPATLIDKKTLLSKKVYVKPETYNVWMSNEGLDKMLTAFKEESSRHRYIEVEGHWLGLTYKDGNRIQHLNGIEYAPKGTKSNQVTPITYAELIYTALAFVYKDYPAFVTRYPIVSSRSTYPSFVYLKTTTKSIAASLVDDNESVLVDLPEYPLYGSPFYNTLSPHTSRLALLGADFDGDTSSFNVAYTEDAKKEVTQLLKSKSFYLGPDGEFKINFNSDTLQYVMHNLTGD